jgi:hypothetical protein
MKYFLFLFVFSFLSACKSDSTSPKRSSAKQASAVAVKTVNLPSISEETMGKLFNNCDQVDFIFHYQSFSMNIAERSTIITNLKGIDPQPVVEFPGSCKPQGRIAYYSKGEMITEADLYFEETCKFMLFMENEKPVAGNYLNKKGIDFLNTLFSRVKNQ